MNDDLITRPKTFITKTLGQTKGRNKKKDKNILAKLSRKANYLARLLVIYIVADFVLTPLGGLETRPVSYVTTVGVTTLALLFVGLGLNVICLVLTLRHRKRSPVFGMIGSVLYFPAAIADQTGQFSTLTPPTGISYVEVIEAIVAIAIIVLSAMVLREKPEAQPKPLQ